MVIEECSSTITDAALRGRLALSLAALETAELRYGEHGQRAELFQLNQTNETGVAISAEEMRWLYTAKLSKKGQAPRHIYDTIKTSSKYGICPLCAHRVVSTLDHYLAKSRHPIYAVTPYNILPSCSDCNKLKIDRQPSTASDQTLHPYFDSVDDAVWLKATVVQGSPPAAIFIADPPETWQPVKRERVCLHFRIFRLSELYAANSAQELAQISYGLKVMSDLAGNAAVRDHLKQQAVTRSTCEHNSWQAALYEALANSEWFWSGGHRGLSN